MLGWAVTFLIVALVAALLGFGGIAGVAIEAAKIVFFVAIVLFAISVIAGSGARRTYRLSRSVVSVSVCKHALCDFRRTGLLVLARHEIAPGMPEQVFIRRRLQARRASFHRGRNLPRC